MALGPLELMVVSFPAEDLNDGVWATLDRLERADQMCVVDALVVRSDQAGGGYAVELIDLPGIRGDPDVLAALATGLITETDITDVAELLDDDAMEVLAVLLEHRWIGDLAGRVAATRGQIVALTHISGAPSPVY
ncbi:DUF6325 family protein [Actinoplanes sp. NPDC048796]|uniref:DUF6325 family protein n=1 Tax=Actinoplanes sp. NPDC048796 TaxID=3155640 RepID=UPI0033EDB755